MRWVAKSNEDEWRARVFSFLFFFRRMHFFFLFSISYVLVRKTQLFHFPSSAHTRNLQQKVLWKVFCLSLHTTHSTIELSWHETFFFPRFSSYHPLLHFPSNKERLCQGKRLFYFYPCVQLARKNTELEILMTLTLNENEVTINYIKYHIAF